MLYPVDPPAFYCRESSSARHDGVVSLSTDPCGEVLAAVCPTRLDFWSTGPHVAHLLSCDLPGTDTETEDVAQLVLWGPSTSATTLVVATMKQLLFFSAEIPLSTQRLLQTARSRDDEEYLCFLETAPAVTLSTKVTIESGFVSGLTAAGSQAFLVWTTSGMLYAVGWASQRILHRWNTADLNQPQHRLTLAVAPLSPAGRTQSKSSPLASEVSTLGSSTARQSSSLPPQPHVHGPGSVVRKATTEVQSTSEAHTDANDGVELSDEVRTEALPRSQDTLLKGVIVDVNYSVPLKLLSLVFSSGQLVLATPSCGMRFADAGPDTIGFNGTISGVAAGAMITRIRLNARHLLAALTTQDGRVACYGLTLEPRPQLNANPLWKGLRCVEEDRQRCGPVQHMEWDSTEEMLCVAYTQLKMLVLEFSGACTLNTAAAASLHQPRGAAGEDESMSTSEATQNVHSGCTAFTWQTSGPNIFVAPHGAQGGSTIAVYPLCRVIAPAEMGGPCVDSPTTATLLLGSHTILIPTADAMERFHVPHAQLGDNFPLCYGAITTEGWRVVCAGKDGGAILFDRLRRRWCVLQRTRTEDHFRCVADPVWLLDQIVVLPTRDHATRTHTMLAYAGVLPFLSSTMVTTPEPLAVLPVLDAQQLLTLTASARPASAGGFLAAYTRQQHVYVYRYQVSADDVRCPTKLGVTFQLVRHIELGARLRWPLKVQPVATATRSHSTTPSRALSKKMAAPHLVFHCRHTHTLVWCHSQTKQPAGYEPRSAGARPDEPATPAVVQEDNLWSVTPFRTRAGALAVVRAFWFDCSAPLEGLTLIASESEGLFLYHVTSMKVGSAPQVRRSLVAFGSGLESIPIGPITHAARVLCVPAGSPHIQSALLSLSRQRRDAQQRSPRSPSTTAALQIGFSSRDETLARVVPYGHRVLAAVLVTTLAAGDAGDAQGETPAVPQSSSSVGPHNLSFPWETRLFYWLEKLRRNSQFVPIMDTLLRSIVEEHPPAGIRDISRRGALRATVSLLRHYPEFYEVTVGCLRKLDMARWPLLLDLIGTPEDLFTECLSTGQLAVAMHVTRIMLLSSFRPHERKEADVPAVSPASSSVSLDTPPPSDAQSGAASSDATTAKGMAKSVQCALELFGRQIASGEYVEAYELLRFLALLRHNVTLPVTDTPGEDALSREYEFCKQILRRKIQKQPLTTLSDINAIGAFAALAFDTLMVQRGERAAHEADEEKQRQEGLRILFDRQTEVCRAVDAEATRLLCSGRLRRLVQLLSVFSLSADFFISQKLQSESVVAQTAPLSSLVVALHEEFGLPLAPRGPPSLTASVAAQLREAPAREAVATLVSDAGLMTTTDLWSAAQFVIFSSPRILRGLLALCHLFAGHTSYQLALTILMMAEPDVVALVVPRTRASAHVVSEDVHWVSVLAALPRRAPLYGYLPFVESVIRAIPPNALKNTQ